MGSLPVLPTFKARKSDETVVVGVAWAAAYLATDSTSATREPPSVRVPAGMAAAWDELETSGKLPYDPSRITTPATGAADVGI